MEESGGVLSMRGGGEVQSTLVLVIGRLRGGVLHACFQNCRSALKMSARLRLALLLAALATLESRPRKEFDFRKCSKASREDIIWIIS
jgi:hypothetical protein